MKALLIGEIYSENLGDQLVYFATKMILNEKYPKMQITELDIMGRSDYSIETTNTILNNEKFTKRMRILIRNTVSKFEIGDYFIKFRRAKLNIPFYESIICEQFDVAIFVGGQVVSDTFGTYIDEIFKLLMQKRIPVIFHAVGLGKLTNNAQRKKYTRIFNNNNVIGISCRCNPNRFNSLLLKDSKIKATVTFDSGIFASELYNINRKISSQYIGLGIMMSKRYDTEDLVQFWVNIISKLNKKKIEWKAFTTGQTSDYLLAKRVLIRAGYSEKEVFNKLVDKPFTPFDLTKTIADFDRILSFRLHSHIIAYSLNIPSVAIEWDKKIGDFMKSIENYDSYFSIEDKLDDIINTLLVKSRLQNYKSNLLSNKNFFKKNLYDLIDTVLENNS